MQSHDEPDLSDRAYLRIEAYADVAFLINSHDPPEHVMRAIMEESQNWPEGFTPAVDYWWALMRRLPGVPIALCYKDQGTTVVVEMADGRRLTVEDAGDTPSDNTVAILSAVNP